VTEQAARTIIPSLSDLLYERCGYTVASHFTPDIVELHGGDWVKAERHWEDIVARVLDTDAVDRRANGRRAIKQAVEAASAFLLDDELWPWCPICQCGTAAEQEGETGGR